MPAAALIFGQAQAGWADVGIGPYGWSVPEWIKSRFKRPWW